jgi:hypothetical protein
MPHVEKVKTTGAELGSHNFSMITIVCGDKGARLFAVSRPPPASKVRRMVDAVPLIAGCDTSYREI